MILSQLIEKRNWDGLDKYLVHLSNSEFRRTEVMVRKYLSHVDNDLFWEAYLHLLMFRHQAFLVCILSIENLAKKDEINFSCDGALTLSQWALSTIPADVPKMVRMAIPLLTTEKQIDGLLHLFAMDNEREWISILLKEDTPLAFYMLFKALRTIDDHSITLRCSIALMQKNTDLSYNMACILKHYFGINELKATFSLTLQPYELSYLEQNYNNFKHILTGKRPRL